jgi:hypothetical protein
MTNQVAVEEDETEVPDPGPSAILGWFGGLVEGLSTLNS